MAESPGPQEGKHDPGASAATLLSRLKHELHNCLYAIQLGLEVLKLTRYDDAKFHLTWSSLEKERQKASNLVDRLAEVQKAPPNL